MNHETPLKKNEDITSSNLCLVSYLLLLHTELFIGAALGPRVPSSDPISIIHVKPNNIQDIMFALLKCNYF